MDQSKESKNTKQHWEREDCDRKRQFRVCSYKATRILYRALNFILGVLITQLNNLYQASLQLSKFILWIVITLVVACVFHARPKKIAMLILLLWAWIRSWRVHSRNWDRLWFLDIKDVSIIIMAIAKVCDYRWLYSYLSWLRLPKIKSCIPNATWLLITYEVQSPVQ
jgi:hypothetical protein